MARASSFPSLLISMLVAFSAWPEHGHCQAQVVDPGIPQAVRMQLPDGWDVARYQWLDSSRIVVTYHADDKSPLSVGVFDTRTGAASTSDMLPDAEWFILSLESPFWRICPNGRFLVAAPRGNYLAVDLTSKRKLASARRKAENHVASGQDSNWVGFSPDSTSWIECWHVAINGQLSLSDLPVGGRPERYRKSEYVVPHTIVPIGLTSSLTIVVASQLAPTSDAPWYSETLALGRTARTVSSWRIAIPHLVEIREGSVSPDNKRICWIATCYRPPYKPPRRYAGPMAAEVWMGDIEGKSITMVARIDLGDVDDYQYIMRHLALPGNIQWTPDGDAVCYGWKGGVWTISGLPGSQ